MWGTQGYWRIKIHGISTINAVRCPATAVDNVPERITGRYGRGRARKSNPRAGGIEISVISRDVCCVGRALVNERVAAVTAVRKNPGGAIRRQKLSAVVLRASDSVIAIDWMNRNTLKLRGSKLIVVQA